jgi:hypothetical protein
MTTPTPPHNTLGTVTRRSMLWLAGSVVAPALAAPWDGAARQHMAALAQELGLAGHSATQFIEQVAAAVGTQCMGTHLNALRARMEDCHYDEAEMADTLRMWGRDDFVQDRTMVVEGIAFAHTELAVFELLRRG